MCGCLLSLPCCFWGAGGRSEGAAAGCEWGPLSAPSLTPLLGGWLEPMQWREVGNWR